MKTQLTRVASRKKRVVKVSLAMGGPSRGQRVGLDAPTISILYSCYFITDNAARTTICLVPKYVVYKVVNPVLLRDNVQ